MNTHLEFDRTLRIAVIRYFVEKGRAPDTHELGTDYDVSPEHVEASLTRLHEHHGLVLHPHSHRIWLAHPFSTAPTHFFVEPVASGNGAAAAKAMPAKPDAPANEASSENQIQPRGWWANCAKCAMGVAAITGGNVNIHTRLAAEAEPVTLEIRDGRPTRSDLVMHVALPVARWWENVCYTCSTILFFRSEPQIAAWSNAHAINHGAVLTMDQAWGLASRWYGSALQPDWRRKTAAEATELFQSLGLTGEFWAVPPSWK